MRAKIKAENSGLSVEILVMLDRSDTITREVVARSGIPQVIETEYGDPAQARNHAVRVANGQFIAFLDADDLWGENWLVCATEAALMRTDSIIWHPEICVYFGQTKQIFQHIDMEEKNFHPIRLMVENYWTALTFGQRKIYLEHPYPVTNLQAGLGYEDWSWNMEIINHGVKHKIVPGTGHVIRRRANSVSRISLAVDAVPHPTNYIQNYLRAR